MKRTAKQAIKRLIQHLAKTHPRMIELLIEEMVRHRYKMPFPLFHYYSPLPDISAVKSNLNRWHKKSQFDPIKWDLGKQKAFLNLLQEYKAESDALPGYAQVTADGYGLGYGEVEAHLLHCMVRRLKPRKVIEVGAGVSTFFLLNALRMNSRDGFGQAEVVCIEPYPSLKIEELAREDRIRLLSREVQDVEIGTFRGLGENDILFIDSSHVAKVDSDVNWLFLEVLPSLNKGVVIHIHDIPFPDLTVLPDHPLFDETLYWNEAALLKAFMMYNDVFDILMCQSYLHRESPEAIKNIVSMYDRRKHFPSSIWLVKNA